MNWSIPRRPGGRAITHLLARAFIGRKLRACSDALVSCRGAAWLLFAGAVYELSLALLHVAGITRACSDVLPFNAFCFLVASTGMLRETGGSVRSTRMSLIAPFTLMCAGAVVLVEWLQRLGFSLDARYLDRLLADPASQSYPVAALTAIGFVFCGGALLHLRGLAGPRNAVGPRVFIYGTVLTGIIGLLCQSMAIGGLWRWGELFVVAPLNGTGFVLAGATLWCVWAKRQPGVSILGESANARVPVIAALVVVSSALAVGVMLASLMVRSDEAAERSELLGDTVEQAATLSVILQNTQEHANAFATRQQSRLQHTPCAGSAELCAAALDMSVYVGPDAFASIRLIGSDGRVLSSAGRRLAAPDQIVPVRPSVDQPGVKAQLLWHSGFVYRQRSELLLQDADGILVPLALETEQTLPILDSIAATRSREGRRSVLCGLEGRLLRCFAATPSELPHNLAIDPALGNRPLITPAFHGEAGTQRHRDSRSDDVVVAYAPVGNTGLATASKIKTEVFLAPVQHALLVAVGVMALCALAGTLFLRARIVPIVKAQHSAAGTAARSEAQLRAITDALPSLVGFVDTSETYRYANAAFATMLGTPPEEVIGRTMREHLGDAQYQISERYIQRALAGEPQQFERSVMSPHGSIYVDMRYIPHRNAEERVDGFHVVVTDITARVEQVTALERAAKIDPLTGSANRRAFMHAVGDAVNDRRRHGTRVGLCYIDVDHFKIINDTYGHAAGDEVLRVAAQRLRTATRDDDLVGRLGGDEFVVLLGRLRDDDAARVVARKLVDAFSTPVTFRGQAISVSISVGVALDEEGTRYTPDELLQAADCALYEVKRNGRASWRLATAVAHGPVDRAAD